MLFTEKNIHNKYKSLNITVSDITSKEELLFNDSRHVKPIVFLLLNPALTPEMLRKILDIGIKLNLQTRVQTFAYYLCLNPSFVREIKHYQEFLKDILKIKGYYGETCLEIILKNPAVTIETLEILDYHTDWEIFDKYGGTMLHILANNYYIPFVLRDLFYPGISVYNETEHINELLKIPENIYNLIQDKYSNLNVQNKQASNIMENTLMSIAFHFTNNNWKAFYVQGRLCLNKQNFQFTKLSVKNTTTAMLFVRKICCTRLPLPVLFMIIKFCFITD